MQEWQKGRQATKGRSYNMTKWDNKQEKRHRGKRNIRARGGENVCLKGIRVREEREKGGL